MNVIKWQLNFGLCNFGLKSYLWFQMEHALRARLILKSPVWFQTKLHSTQFNCHYKFLTYFACKAGQLSDQKLPRNSKWESTLVVSHHHGIEKKKKLKKLTKYGSKHNINLARKKCQNSVRHNKLCHGAPFQLLPPRKTQAWNAL